MKVYLVDFENVKSKGLAGVDKLTEYDRVIIFYSENADTINFEMHQRVMMSKADVEYFKVNVGGKNALDFQLSTLLGYLVARQGYSHLFVISNDKSFDFLHDFWHGKYITSPDCVVYRTRTISAAINYTSAKKADEDASGEDVDNANEESVFEQESVGAETQEQEAAAEQEEPKQEKVPAAAAVKTEPKSEAGNAPAETSDVKASPKLDDTQLFEYYQQFYNDAKEETHKHNEKPEPKQQEAVTKLVEMHEEQKAAQTDEPAKPADNNGGTFEEMFFAALDGMEYTEDEVEHIATLLVESETKEEFHNGLAKEFKQQATELYKALRPRYLRLKEKYAAENNISEDKNPAPVKQEAKNDTTNAPAAEKPAAKSTAKKSKQEAKNDTANAPASEKPAAKSTAKKSKQEAKNDTANAPAAEKPAAKSTAKKPKQEAKNDTAADPRIRLAQLLDGICTEEEFAMISELFDNADTKQQLYIRMVKAFKKDRGCKFYNAIKNEYSAIKN